MARGFAPVLRIRNYLLLVLSGSASQLGDRLTHMLLITIIALAGPGRLLTYSAGSFVFVLPTLLLAPVAGVLVDRWNKRRVLGFTHIIQSGLLLACAVLTMLTRSFVPVWIALAVFFGLDVFNNTAYPALLPQLVARRKLLMANALNLTVARVATVVGMVLGGFLLRWTGWQYGLAINASTHLLAGLLALALTTRAPAAGRLPQDDGGPGDGQGLGALVAESFRGLLRDLMELLRVLRVSRPVVFVMASVVVSTFVSAVSYTILLFLVQQELGLGTGGVGIFAGIVAVGMIAGATAMGMVRGRIDRPLVVVFVIAVYCLLFLAGPWLVSIPFMVVTALVAGVVFSWLGIVQNTMLQEEVSADVRGRIFSTREFITNCTFLLTTLFIGTLGDLTTWRTAMFSIGIALGLLAVAGLVYVRRWRA